MKQFPLRRTMLKQCPLVRKLIFYSEIYDLFSIGLFYILVAAAAATTTTSVKKTFNKTKTSSTKISNVTIEN